MKATVATACKGKNVEIAWIIPKRLNIAQNDEGKVNLTDKQGSYRANIQSAVFTAPEIMGNIAVLLRCEIVKERRSKMVGSRHDAGCRTVARFDEWLVA